MYAPLYFDWTLHKNLTAILGYGPTATFNSEWDTNDGVYMVPYSFQITLPVVRPIGETISWQGFTGFIGNGLVGQWLQTLKPPTNDPSFDFTGETVQESFLSSRGVTIYLTETEIYGMLQIIGDSHVRPYQSGLY
jgi:hypothetical protein